jgi:hypothetical protein
MVPDDEDKGAGSGGGPDQGGRYQSFDGAYGITANQVHLISRPPLPPSSPSPFVINILAAGMGTDGRVEVRGSQGVRITAGPPPLPPSSSESTNGAEIIVGELQNITIQRGLIPGVDQKIEMTPTGITVDGGAMPITIQSLTEITLSVAGGLNTIKLAPEGITIQGAIIQVQGVLVQIN